MWLGFCGADVAENTELSSMEKCWPIYCNLCNLAVLLKNEATFALAGCGRRCHNLCVFYDIFWGHLCLCRNRELMNRDRTF